MQNRGEIPPKTYVFFLIENVFADYKSTTCSLLKKVYVILKGIEQHYPIELSTVMDIFYFLLQVQQPLVTVAVEYLKCAQYGYRAGLFILFHFNLNRHTWLVTTVWDAQHQSQFEGPLPCLSLCTCWSFCICLLPISSLSWSSPAPSLFFSPSPSFLALSLPYTSSPCFPPCLPAYLPQSSSCSLYVCYIYT